jgi:uncharacterized membrane protein
MLWEEHKIKILSGLLFLSLAGNCGLVSFMAGQHASARIQRVAAPDSAVASMNSPGGGPPGLQGLPDAQRREAMGIMRSHRPEMQEAMAAVQQQRGVIRDVALQDKLDPQELEAAFAELRSRMVTAQAAGQSMMVELFSMLPLEQRTLIMSRQPRGPGPQP